jgi:large subunit ribosomal protein L24
MQRVQREDTVLVISGKDAGRTGRVVRVDAKRQKALVEGMGIVTKHERRQATRTGAQSGGISHVESYVHLSNVMPICDSCGKATRVGSTEVDGKRHRYCKKCEAEFPEKRR